MGAVPGGVARPDARAALVGRVVVAGIGRVAVAAVAVDRDGGVADEVVAGDDVRGEVGVRDVTGVDDGDGDTAAGRSRPRGGHVHPGGGLEEVPLLAVPGVVRVGLRGVQPVRYDVGDLRVGPELGDDVGDFGRAAGVAEADEGGAGAEAALEVDALAGLLALGGGVGLGGAVRTRLRGAGLVADDEALGEGAGGGLGLSGQGGCGGPGGGYLGDGDRVDGRDEEGRGDRGDGYQGPSGGECRGSAQGLAFRGRTPSSAERRSMRFAVEAVGVEPESAGRGRPPRQGLPVGQLWSNDRQREGHTDTGETLDPAGNHP